MEDRPVDEAEPIAWTAIPPHLGVLDADGRVAARVVEVLGSREEDVFHGLVIDVAGAHRVLLADGISALTTVGVETDRSAADFEALPAYEAGKSYHADLSRGLFGHLKSERFFEDQEDK
jgi:hypothetical protein